MNWEGESLIMFEMDRRQWQFHFTASENINMCSRIITGGNYVTYLLMYFQSMAGWMRCISISLSCCLGDVSQATGGAVVECKVI